MPLARVLVLPTSKQQYVSDTNNSPNVLARVVHVLKYSCLSSVSYSLYQEFVREKQLTTTTCRNIWIEFIIKGTLLSVRVG